MNLTDAKYSKYALVQEMMQTVEVVTKFNPNQTKKVAEEIKSVGRLFLTGEGSSRIFPAKKCHPQSIDLGNENVHIHGWFTSICAI